MPTIDENQMAEFITDKLLKQGIIINKSEVLKVLDIELEYLEIKGIASKTIKR
jgi:hypothetical protein